MEARVLRQHSDVQTSKHLDLSGSGRLSGLRLTELPCLRRCDSSTTYPSLASPPFLRPPDGDLSTQNPGSFPLHPLYLSIYLSLALSRTPAFLAGDVAGDGNTDW